MMRPRDLASEGPMFSHTLTYFEIQKCQNKLKFNGVFSTNIPQLKYGTYVVNLDEYKSTETHYIAQYVNDDNAAYFDSFEVDQIFKEIKLRGNKKMANTYRIQACILIMWECFCIGFIKFMLKAKLLLDYTHLFSPSEYKNNKVLLKCLQ